MSQSDSTTVEVESGGLLYYKELEKHINSLSERFPAKRVIKQCVYADIVKCLLFASEQCPCKKNGVFLVRQNVIQNEVVVKIWVNRVKYLGM